MPGDVSPCTHRFRRWREAPKLISYNPGAVAQLGEHLLCKQGVAGSIPVRSIHRRYCLIATYSGGAFACPAYDQLRGASRSANTQR
jgi:hypothetical protein